MTVSTADFGGTGNGLGLPIANPLYGPGNAAVMAQQAQQQNMLDAQAHTRQTQAVTEQTQQLTNRDKQTLPYDIQKIMATTDLDQQNANQLKLKNEAESYLPTELRAQGIAGDIFGKQTAGAESQHDFLKKRIIENASLLDSMPPEAAKAQLEEWGRNAGMAPGQASAVYGGMANKRGQVPPGQEGMDNNPITAAAVQKVGGYAALRKDILEAQPDIYKTRLQEAGATTRTGMTTATEEKVANIRADTEKAVARLKPEEASQYFTDRYYELRNDPSKAAEAEEYRKQAIDAMNKRGFYDASAAFARQAYQPLNNALGAIGSRITGQPDNRTAPTPAVGAVPQGITPPPIGGVPSGAAPAPAPAPSSAQPQVSQENLARIKQAGPPPAGTVYAQRPDGSIATVNVQNVAVARQRGYIILQ